MSTQQQSSPNSSSSPFGKHSSNSAIIEMKSNKKSKPSSSHQSQFEKLITNNSNKANELCSGKSPKSTNNPQSSTSSSSSSSVASTLPFDSKFYSNPAANVFASQLTGVASGLNPNELANFTSNFGMPPPLFDPEFLRLAASANPLFRFPDFNSATNPYFNSLNNFFRANTQNQNISLPNPANFLDPTTNSSLGLSVNPLSSSSNSQFNSNPQKINQNYGQSNSSETKQNGYVETVKMASSNGILDKNHHNFQSSQKSNKINNGSNHNSSKKGTTNESSNNVLNEHATHLNHNSISNNNGNSVNTLSILSSSSSSSPTSKLKLSTKFSKLNSAEIQTIKTLINSYKESAAFLSRSAEELEQLIGETS